jgi:hypothetical protein
VSGLVRVIPLLDDIFKVLLLCDIKLFLEAEIQFFFNTEWIDQKFSNHAMNTSSLDEDTVPEQWQNT